MHNAEEVRKFTKDAPRWWDEDGPFAPLHRLNPVRMDYIRARIIAHTGRSNAESFSPLDGLNILDVGCGGGLVCEPLARMGAQVTGLDADPVAIAVARQHAAETGLDITYKNETANSLLSSLHGSSVQSMDHTHKACDDSSGFDVVLALEIIEHVDDPQAFVRSCTSLLKPDGLIIFSTLNRTPKAYALGVIAAEYLLRWVPRGTHEWKKFVKPSELAAALRTAGLTPQDVTGMTYNPFKSAFELSKNDLDVNYFLSATRP